MGVGDYIHSKEAHQFRAVSREIPNPSRQLLAEQARVDVSAASFAAPIANGANERTRSELRNGLDHIGLTRVPSEGSPHGDMFDTDVDGVDDSTIGGATTVLDPDEDQQLQLQPGKQIQNADADKKLMHYLRPDSNAYGYSWYENLGDKAMKSAGFDSDDADDDASQLAPSFIEGCEKRPGSTDWYYSHKRRPGEEPLSKRLEGFWSASKRVHSKPSNTVQDELSQPLAVAGHNPRNTCQLLPPMGGGGMASLPRDRATASRARTRFSPPKPSLWEQLDISPNRDTGLRAIQPIRKENALSAPLDDAGLLADNGKRRDSENTVAAFDATNLDVLEIVDDDAIQDICSGSSFIERTSACPAVSKKRELEADYPPEILYQKSLVDLQTESFDFTPTPTVPPSEIREPQPDDTEDKVSLLLRLSDQGRANYLSNMSIEEWDECGDQLAERFSLLLSQMRGIRRARRKTAAVFEAEIKRRHDLVENQATELSSKLDDIRAGSAEVLRGRKQPQSDSQSYA